MSRILIAFFSMGGHTRDLAEEIRKATAADIEEISEVHPRYGLRGMLRALWDASWRRKTPIHPLRRDPADYDLLVLGGPIWAKHLAAPVRSFAEYYQRRSKQVAFFCTEGGSGAEEAFADLERLYEQSPVATLVVDAKHLVDHRAELGRFIARLMRYDGACTDAAGTSDAVAGPVFRTLRSGG